MSEVRTYYVEGEWVVADDGGWFPGTYDSEATARRAATVPFVPLTDLWESRRPGPLTSADLDAIETPARPVA